MRIIVSCMFDPDIGQQFYCFRVVKGRSEGLLYVITSKIDNLYLSRKILFAVYTQRL